MFWIYFIYNQQDIIGARINGDKAEVFWNEQKLKDKQLSRAYDVNEFRHLNPMMVREAIFNAVGGEALSITDLRIHNGDLDWNGLLKSVKG